MPLRAMPAVVALFVPLAVNLLFPEAELAFAGLYSIESMHFYMEPPLTTYLCFQCDLHPPKSNMLSSHGAWHEFPLFWRFLEATLVVGVVNMLTPNLCTTRCIPRNYGSHEHST